MNKLEWLFLGIVIGTIAGFCWGYVRGVKSWEEIPRS